MKVQNFQMADNTHNVPESSDGQGGGGLPPPPQMTPTEAFMVAQAEVMRQILNTQNLIA